MVYEPNINSGMLKKLNTAATNAKKMTFERIYNIPI